MSFRFHLAAKQEFIAAVKWYKIRSPALGEDFATATLQAIQRADAMPDAWPPITPGLRRVLVHRFPYAVIYAMDGDQLVVFAVMHFRRKPGYWRERLSN